MSLLLAGYLNPKVGERKIPDARPGAELQPKPVLQIDGGVSDAKEEQREDSNWVRPTRWRQPEDPPGPWLINSQLATLKTDRVAQMGIRRACIRPSPSRRSNWKLQ